MNWQKQIINCNMITINFQFSFRDHLVFNLISRSSSFLHLSFERIHTHKQRNCTATTKSEGTTAERKKQLKLPEI
jgi:hypothetical protein